MFRTSARHRKWNIFTVPHESRPTRGETQWVAYDSLAPGGKFIDQWLPRHDQASGKRVLHVWGSLEVTAPGMREFGQRFMLELSGWLTEGKIKVRQPWSIYNLTMNPMMSHRADYTRIWRKCTRQGAERRGSSGSSVARSVPASLSYVHKKQRFLGADDRSYQLLFGTLSHAHTLYSTFGVDLGPELCVESW